MSATTRLDLLLDARPSSVRAAREAVVGSAAGLGLSRDVLDDIRLCVSEAVANVVRYAYLGGPGEVHVSCDRFRDGALVVVRDFGFGTASGRAPQNGDGGFGWRIIEALADRYTVKSTPEDGTEVWMSFGSSSAQTRTRRRPRRARRGTPAAQGSSGD
jgi:anti-sigma regulatory factor (Ser/Thr protein kinase)